MTTDHDQDLATAKELDVDVATARSMRLDQEATIANRERDDAERHRAEAAARDHREVGVDHAKHPEDSPEP
jgi:hypothetical protein